MSSRGLAVKYSQELAKFLLHTLLVLVTVAVKQRSLRFHFSWYVHIFTPITSLGELDYHNKLCFQEACAVNAYFTLFSLIASTSANAV